MIHKRFYWHGLVVLVFLTFLLGCGSHIKELRQAQDQFNLAASLDNRFRMRMFDPEGLSLKGQAQASYLLTLRMLDNLLDNKRKQLQEDNLLGITYTLKALCQWRLRRFSEAMDTVYIALQEDNITLFPRDRAILIALKGLIMNDQGYIHMTRGDYPYEKIVNLFNASIDNIQEAFNSVPEEHDLRLYLSVSELAVLKNWKDLRGQPEYAALRPEGFDPDQELKKWCVRARPVWDQFLNTAGRTHQIDFQSLIGDWARRLSLPQACKVE